MSSVIVSWNGTCPGMANRMALIGYLQILAEAFAKTIHAPECDDLWYSEKYGGMYRPGGRHDIPRIRVFDSELTGNIILLPSVVPDSQFSRLYERVRRKKKHMVLMREESTNSVARRFTLEEFKQRCYLRLSRLRVFGIDFRLFDPPGLDPGLDRISFVFLESPDLSALHGCVARLKNHDQCAVYEDEVIQCADWLVSVPHIHLRYFLQDWTDSLLSWIKYFFIPDLVFYSREAFCSYDTFRSQFDQQCQKKGRNETRMDSFNDLLGWFKYLASHWPGFLVPGNLVEDSYPAGRFQEHMKVLLDPNSSWDALAHALDTLCHNVRRLSDAEVSQLNEATHRLVSLVRDEESLLSSEAVTLLGRIGPRALPALRRQLSEVSDNVGWRTLKALVACGGESDVIEILATSRDHFERLGAVDVLQDGRLEVVVPALLRFIHDTDELVRLSAIQELFYRLNDYARDYWDQCVDFICALFDAVQRDDRICGTDTALTSFKLASIPLRTAVRLVLSPLSACSAEARLMAAKTCREAVYLPGETRLVEALEECARQDPVWDVCAEARNSLKTLRDQERYYSYQIKDLLQ